MRSCKVIFDAKENPESPKYTTILADEWTGTKEQFDAVIEYAKNLVLARENAQNTGTQLSAEHEKTLKQLLKSLGLPGCNYSEESIAKLQNAFNTVIKKGKQIAAQLQNDINSLEISLSDDPSFIGHVILGGEFKDKNLNETFFTATDRVFVECTFENCQLDMSYVYHCIQGHEGFTLAGTPTVPSWMRPMYIDCTFKKCTFKGDCIQPDFGDNQTFSNVFRHCHFEDCDFSRAGFACYDHKKDQITCRFTRCNFTMFMKNAHWDFSKATFDDCTCKVLLDGTNASSEFKEMACLVHAECAIDLADFSDVLSPAPALNLNLDFALKVRELLHKGENDPVSLEEIETLSESFSAFLRERLIQELPAGIEESDVNRIMNWPPSFDPESILEELTQGTDEDEEQEADENAPGQNPPAGT